MNASSHDYKLPSGRVIGTACVIEDANINFENEVSNFTPLDIDGVKRMAASSKFTPCSRLTDLTSSEKLTEVQRRMLLLVLSHHESTFQWDKTGFGRTQLMEHSIDTADSKPIKQR